MANIFSSEMARLGTKLSGYRRQLSDLGRTTRGFNPDSVLRAKASLERRIRETEGAIAGLTASAVAEGMRDLTRERAAEIARLKRPGAKERLLGSGPAFEALKSMRLRRLADAQKALVGKTETETPEEIAVDDKADLIESIGRAVADAIEILADDPAQVAILVERLQGVLNRIEILAEKAKGASALAPQAALDNALTVEMGRALQLAAKVRGLRTRR